LFFSTTDRAGCSRYIFRSIRTCATSSQVLLYFGSRRAIPEDPILVLIDDERKTHF
jgi:hypothetical protein